MKKQLIGIFSIILMALIGSLLIAVFGNFAFQDAGYSLLSGTECSYDSKCWTWHKENCEIAKKKENGKISYINQSCEEKTI